MKCPQCDETLSPHLDRCPYCHTHIGFPNVRAAEDERAELDRRHAAARVAAASRGYEAEFDRFEAAVAKGSRAVVCKGWGAVLDHAREKSEIFATFHEQIRNGARRVKNDPYEQVRPAVDGLLFPHYAEKISFGALSLDGKAPVSYGVCRFQLREKYIANRATVFETNSLVFVRDRAVPAVGPVPPGYRATWAERGRLAATKHAVSANPTGGFDLAPGIPDSAFPGILFRDEGREGGFVEVHVYDKIEAQAVEKLTMPKPPKSDRPLAKRVQSVFEKDGVRVEWE